ncbi:hypothetical protein FPOAC2_04225 [Fusarium poae]
MAYPASDPFTKLPAELRLRVIMSTNCTTTISQLIRASPSMLQQYLMDRRYIQRHIIDYDEDMMQDAMAIILIPHWPITSKEEPDEDIVKRARAVLEDWSNGQLPHPTQHDHATSQLNELHNRILVLAEDYITKATASFPPREYLCLPQIQRPSANGHLMFKGVKVARRFDLADLTASEKKRVFKAFMRHELMSRANSLFPWETREIHVPKRLVGKAESHGIICVRDYYCSLYGAMFAQCSDSQLPSSPTGTTLKTDLKFPDTFHFDANTYAHELDLHDATWREEFPDFASWFSRLGIDRLTEFLRYDMGNEDDRDALFDHLQDTWFNGGKKYGFGLDVPWASIFNVSRSSHNACYDSNMFKQLSGSFEKFLQWDIARQRAWVFFDDTRLYPQETIERPNFPSSSFLQEKTIQTNSVHD